MLEFWTNQLLQNWEWLIEHFGPVIELNHGLAADVERISNEASLCMVELEHVGQRLMHMSQRVVEVTESIERMMEHR